MGPIIPYKNWVTKMFYLNVFDGEDTFFEKSGEELTPRYVFHDVIKFLLRLKGVGQTDLNGKVVTFFITIQKG